MEETVRSDTASEIAMPPMTSNKSAMGTYVVIIEDVILLRSSRKIPFTDKIA